MTDSSIIVEVLNEERSGLGLFRIVDDVACATSVGTIVVAAGYKTDFASIPRIARWLLPQCGRSARAALLHDWLLRQKDIAVRRSATRVFSEELKLAGAGPFRRLVMVAFVAAFTFPDLYL